jgi:LAS superfamily LD-carboxypeptidase LdcB
VTSGYRSLSEQRRLYALYTSGRHRYPVAPPGKSYHNYGLAVDVVTRNNHALGRWWESIGGTWGGARDPVHFQAS